MTAHRAHPSSRRLRALLTGLVVVAAISAADGLRGAETSFALGRRTAASIACAVVHASGLDERGEEIAAGQAVPRAPDIDLRVPPGMEPQARRFSRFDTGRLVAVMRLVGLEDAGPKIRVFLAPEEGPLARQTPTWIAGFASGSGDVVIFPSRTPSYPHGSLEALLQHEVAHVLIDRAAGGRHVPRWFHEGVALAAERTWGLGDRTQFAIDVALSGPVPVWSLDRLFEAGPREARRAYRLSGLLLQDLLETHGPDLPARVLAVTRAGATFDAAFRRSAGIGVDEASQAFWDRRRLWVTWLPWATSPGALWTVVTLLAIAAIARARWRRAARRWDDQEGD